LGQGAHQKQDDEAAILHLKRAVELDPNLAMAYATLGVASLGGGGLRECRRHKIPRLRDCRT